MNIFDCFPTQLYAYVCAASEPSDCAELCVDKNVTRSDVESAAKEAGMKRPKAIVIELKKENQ